MQETKQIQRLKTDKSPNPKPKKTRNRNSNDPLSQQEVEVLLNAVHDLGDYTLLLFGFSSGIRVGELQFDYNAISWGEGFVNIWDEKKNRYRRVYLAENILNSLKRFWNERGDKRKPRFFDFSTKTAERKIQQWTKKVLDKSKSWHCVRHTYITLSFEKQIPISVVIENTGDKPVTILQYYTKLSPTFIKEQINTKPLFKVI
jgi:integrase